LKWNYLDSLFGTTSKPKSSAANGAKVHPCDDDDGAQRPQQDSSRTAARATLASQNPDNWLLIEDDMSINE